MPGSGVLHVAKAFTEKAKPHVWAEKLLRWGLEQAETLGVTHLVQLQDDVIPAPNFWKAAAALVEAYPDQLLGLETAHPLAPQLAADPDETIRIITTTDGLIGVGWIFPIPLVREFLEWRATKLKPGGIEAITEDTLIGVWCLATGRRVFHPVPTLIDHDLSLESTYGNDAHANRRPTVRWDMANQFGDAWDARELEAPNFWRGGRKRVPLYAPDGTTFLEMRTAYNTDPSGASKAIRHLGRFYDATPSMARQWVEGFDERAFIAAMRDDSRAELRRLVHAKAARVGITPSLSVVLCSPNKGTTHPQYNATVWKAIQEQATEITNAFELVGARQWTEDLVRIRSRFARLVLELGADVMWNLDADVSHEHELFRGLIATGRDFVCAPYARRDSINLEAIAAHDPMGRLPAARAYRYNVELIPESLTPDGKQLAVDDKGCVEVGGMPLGCSMIRRSVLEKMTEHYGQEHEHLNLVDMRNTHGAGRSVLYERIEKLCAELERWREGREGLVYTDVVDGVARRTVALFQLQIDETLRGEDMSFCARWRAMGGKVYMYLGPGTPAVHHGEHAYAGHVGAFGVKRVESIGAPPAPPSSPYDHGPVAAATDRTPEDG